ncbi:DUF1444 family protein [Planctomicrobium sp. SH668]|uniref:DUF1444 family protein n=1 Tax=Planctomicrobium sp. SH668 TaxID=3448126 RepID=UPI003F5B3334
MKLAEIAPDHWKHYTSQTNWFRLRFPPQWIQEEHFGAFALRPPGSDAIIAINTIWVDAENRGPVPSLLNIANQFPQTRNIKSLAADPLIDHSIGVMQGEAVLTPPLGWWGKLWKKDEWRTWKMWGLQRSQLIVVVTLLHPKERDPELEAITHVMLRCLELPEHPADPPEVFATKAADFTRRKFPLIKVELHPDFKLLIDTSILSLTNFYRAYVREPAKFEQILLPAISTAVQVRDWGETELSPPLELVRDRLMPMLYPEEAWKGSHHAIAGETWVAGLVVLYVVDEANSYWFVRRDLMEKWGLSQDEIHEIALDNLMSYFEREPVDLVVNPSPSDVPAILIPSKADSYNAARLLCHSYLSQLRMVAEGDLAVGIPGRDFFMAVSAKSPSMIERIRSRVKDDFRQTDHPLTNRILLVTADGVSELVQDDAY